LNKNVSWTTVVQTGSIVIDSGRHVY